MSLRLISFLILLGTMPICSVYAQETSGSCGDDLTWSLETIDAAGNYVLKIDRTGHGLGVMDNYSAEKPSPWDGYKDKITHLQMDDITCIGDYAFYGCAALNNGPQLVIPITVTTIGESAFQNTGFKEIIIPNATNIGKNAFNGCLSLANVVLGAFVETIGDCAFNGCTSLTTVESHNIDAPTLGSNVFSNENVTSTLNYPKQGTTNTYISWIGYFDSSVYLKCGDDLTWTYDGIETLTIEGNGEMTNYNSIADQPWSWYQSEITEIVIKDGVTSIGNCAFQSCTETTKVSLPSTITKIGEYAFSRTEITNITLPDNLTTIGKHAFYSTPITGVVIPDKVEIISYYVFNDCSSLTSVTIGSGVTTIQSLAFSGCTQLYEIKCKAENPPTFDNTFGYGNYFKDVPSTAIVYVPSEYVNAYQTAEVWKDFNIYPIDNYFIKEIKDGDNLLYSLRYTFIPGTTNVKVGVETKPTAETTLTLSSKVTHGNVEYTLTEIADNGFKECDKFTGALTIPNTVTRIGDYAFNLCTGFNDALSFAGTDATPSQLQVIGKYAFAGFQSTTASGAYTNDVIKRMNFTDGLKFPESLTTIGERAFWECNGFTGDIRLPNSVTSIGRYAFDSCDGFDGMIIISENANLTTLESHLFYDCNNVKSIVIPEQITRINVDVFKECRSVKEIFSKALEAPTADYDYTYNSDIFHNVDKETAKLYVAEAALESYRTTSPWYDFKNIVVHNAYAPELNEETKIEVYYKKDDAGNVISSIDNQEVTAGNDIYSLIFTPRDDDKRSLQVECGQTPTEAISLILPDSISITIDENNTFKYPVTKIKENAFYREVAFATSTQTHNGHTHTEVSALNSCRFFTGDLIIPNTVTHIGESAFRLCTDAKFDQDEDSDGDLVDGWEEGNGFNGKLELSDNLIYIGDYAFAGFQSTRTDTQGYCDGQNLYMQFQGSLVIPNSVEYIGDHAFWECKKFTGDLIIPNSVTHIGKYAFDSCWGLDGMIQVPEDITTITERSFYDCNNVKTLVLPSSITRIEMDAFNECRAVTEIICEASYVPATFYDEEYDSHVFNGIDQNDTGAVLYVPEEALNLYIAARNTADKKNPWNFYYEENGVKNIRAISSNLPEIETDDVYTIIEVKDNNSGSVIYSMKFTRVGAVTEQDNTAAKSLQVECYKAPTQEISLSIPKYVKIEISNKEYSYPVTKIKDNGFNATAENMSGCANFIGTLEIPNTVKVIGSGAFKGCTGFTGYLSLPKSTTNIKDHAFDGCTGFYGNMIIPNSVAEFGSYAFNGCNFDNVFCYRVEATTFGEDIFGANPKYSLYVPSIAIPQTNNQEKASAYIKAMPTFTENNSNIVCIDIDGTTTIAIENYSKLSTYNIAINAPLVIGTGSTISQLAVNSFGLCEGGSLTINEGGQFLCNLANDVATVTKSIISYVEKNGSKTEEEGVELESGWYSIAFPFVSTEIESSNLTTTVADNTVEYELFRYDEPTAYWHNAKNSYNNGFNSLELGRGYLYARLETSGETTVEKTLLSNTAYINTDEVAYQLSCKYTNDALKGFNLLGNPFTHDIYKGVAFSDDKMADGYYVLSNSGAWVTKTDNDVIKYGQGFLVKATEAHEITILNIQDAPSSNDAKSMGDAMLTLSVSNEKYDDKALVMFTAGRGLDKIAHLNEDIPMIYVTTDNDYAIAMADRDFTELSVGFDAATMGHYTISLKQNNIAFEELYLLDKETGVKVDILEEDYTFMAMSGDDPDRFVLMNGKGQQTTDDSNFVFVHKHGITLLGIEGNAHIDIYDVLGRRVYNNNGSDDVHIVTTDGYSAGVYVVRLMDDKGVRTQKVIID